MGPRKAGAQSSQALAQKLPIQPSANCTEGLPPSMQPPLCSLVSFPQLWRAAFTQSARRMHAEEDTPHVLGEAGSLVRRPHSHALEVQGNGRDISTANMRKFEPAETTMLARLLALWDTLGLCARHPPRQASAARERLSDCSARGPHKPRSQPSMASRFSATDSATDSQPSLLSGSGLSQANRRATGRLNHSEGVVASSSNVNVGFLSHAGDSAESWAALACGFRCSRRLLGYRKSQLPKAKWTQRIGVHLGHGCV